MAKFMPVGRFLARPLEISGLNKAELARAFEQIEGGEARLLGRSSPP